MIFTCHRQWNHPVSTCTFVPFSVWLVPWTLAGMKWLRDWNPKRKIEPIIGRFSSRVKTGNRILASNESYFSTRIRRFASTLGATMRSGIFWGEQEVAPWEQRCVLLTFVRKKRCFDSGRDRQRRLFGRCSGCHDCPYRSGGEVVLQSNLNYDVYLYLSLLLYFISFANVWHILRLIGSTFTCSRTLICTVILSF